MKKRKSSLPVKPLIIGAIVIIALVFTVRYAKHTLENLAYFKIKYIVVNGPEKAVDFSYLLGRGIFGVDLKKESRYISELYPAYKSVRLFKIMPDRLFIGFIARDPAAYVKLHRYFCVDNDMVLFDAPKGQEPQDLPVILGLERKIHGAMSGRRYNIKELSVPLNILKEVKSSNLLKEYKIKRIGAANPADISCFIGFAGYAGKEAAKDSRLLEVKIGQDDTADKIHVLAGLLNQFNGDLNNIKYIDLRFKEAVVKFKDAK
ncbi:MAG: cell division protein FtsQ/DivIB [Candidatus Omnitrophica bacterium]|nr:cell division protein FtsQ/DivIB [Candidatus Omnitrophota bacterium]